MAAANKQFRARLKADLAKQKEMRQHFLHENTHFLHALTHRSKDDDEWRKKMKLEQPAATVTRLLGRHLTPAERLLVPQMQAQGKQPAEVAQLFLELDKAAASRGDAASTKPNR
jgi:hypothetical protein